MSKVSIAKINGDYKKAILRVFDSFGGIKDFIPNKNNGNLYIKINGVSHFATSNTSPQVLGALLDIYIEQGLDPSQIFVIENCTSGLLTRLTMYFTGLTQIIKEKKVNCIYMDEEPICKVKIGKEKFY